MMTMTTIEPAQPTIPFSCPPDFLESYYVGSQVGASRQTRNRPPAPLCPQRDGRAHGLGFFFASSARRASRRSPRRVTALGLDQRRRGRKRKMLGPLVIRSLHL